MRRILSFILFIHLLASCTKQEAMLSSEEVSRRDSMALRVAVMPTLNCLPIFYAERMGLFESSEEYVKLIRYQAQLDIDTAITKKHTDVAFTDLIRFFRFPEQIRDSITPLMQNEEPISMISIKGVRVKETLQMKEKLIAISRLSITDYWCDHMLDSAKINHDEVYRPQINDVKLRADMLHTELIDGSMMAEPYSSWMTQTGHNKLFQTTAKHPQMAIWTVADSLLADSVQRQRIAQFVKTYCTAVNRINQGEHPDTIKAILNQEYGIPPAIVDSIQLPQITLPDTVNTANINEALRWLKTRNIQPKATSTDKFSTTKKIFLKAVEK